MGNNKQLSHFRQIPLISIVNIDSIHDHPLKNVDGLYKHFDRYIFNYRSNNIYKKISKDSRYKFKDSVVLINVKKLTYQNTSLRTKNSKNVVPDIVFLI